MSLYRKAVSTTRAALVIVVILLVVIAGAYLVSRPSQPSQPLQPTVQIPQTLVIDDAAWPIHNLNALYELLYVPWPWWLEHTVYQTLVVTNVTKQFSQGQLDFVADLATDWTVSSDSTTYTYNLRQGVKF
jgi:ABC-type transport system substrate-binding protein